VLWSRFVSSPVETLEVRAGVELLEAEDGGEEASRLDAAWLLDPAAKDAGNRAMG
jgi:hypothetical protein